MTDPVSIRATANSHANNDGTTSISFRIHFPDLLAPPVRTGDNPHDSWPDFTLEYISLAPPGGTATTRRIYEIASSGDYNSNPANGPVSATIPIWDVLCPQDFFQGTYRLTVTWQAASDGISRTERFDFSAGNTLNHPAVETIDFPVPRLCQLLNLVSIQPPPASTNSTPRSQVVDILRHVTTRLDEGLGPIWRSVAGLPTKNGLALRDVTDLSTLSLSELEECWAQHISEYLVATPYGGPASNSRSGMRDPDFFALCIRSTDPIFPLLCECQQLCTMSAITRGFDDAASHPIDSHAPIGATYMASTWDTGSTGRIETDNHYCDGRFARDHGITSAGGIFVKTGLPHAAFVLRTMSSGQFQLLDTSAMRTTPPHASPFPISPGALSSGMNYDTSAADSVTTDSFTHLGWIASRTRLAAGINRLRNSRPHGLARLVLLQRRGTAPSDTDLSTRIQWASPVIPMWSRTSDQMNYPISRFFWSLREHPHATDFEARWLLSIPQDLNPGTGWTTRAFQHLINSGRAFRFTDAEKRRPAASNPMTCHMLPLMDLGSTSDGLVRVTGRFSKASGQYTNILNPNVHRRPSEFNLLNLGEVDRIGLEQTDRSTMPYLFDQ